MQETRQHILEVLRDRQEATVGDIVRDLTHRLGRRITAVTVRHHLGVLQEDDLVTIPHMKHRGTPGRPQHIYILTDKAQAQFPNNYQQLATSLIREIRRTLPDDRVNVILEGVAHDMADSAAISGETLYERLQATCDYLNEHGYEASFESHADGFVLHTQNCPYRHLAHEEEGLCHLDMRLVAEMLGVVPRLLSRISDGENSCSYLIPTKF